MDARIGTMAVLLAALSGWCPAQPATVKVTVPDYTVEKVGEIDEVTIPGGRLKVGEDGTPMVPYWVEKVPVPPGQRVKSVELAGRSGMKRESGLRLPIVQPDDGPAVAPVAGAFPKDEFAWSAGYDGEPTLYLSLFAVAYDPATAALTFHGEYEFEVSYAPVTVRITGVAPGRAAYEPGDEAAVTVRVAGGQAATAELLVTGRDRPGGKTVSRQARFDDPDSVTIAWPTSGLGTGGFDAEVVVRDAGGNELDRGGTLVRVGVPRGEVTGFDVSPAKFRVGDDVRMELAFRNTGSCDLAGDCVFRVQRGGELLDEMLVELPATKPGGTRTFREKWSTAGAEESAVYTAVGYVRYEGTACAPARAEFSTNAMPVAAFEANPDTVAVGEDVSFDGTASKDEDGELAGFRWEFGDGGKGADESMTHRYMQPGDYIVRLTVVDDEGGTDTAERTVTVAE